MQTMTIIILYHKLQQISNNFFKFFLEKSLDISEILVYNTYKRHDRWDRWRRITMRRGFFTYDKDGRPLTYTEFEGRRHRSGFLEGFVDLLKECSLKISCVAAAAAGIYFAVENESFEVGITFGILAFLAALIATRVLPPVLRWLLVTIGEGLLSLLGFIWRKFKVVIIIGVIVLIAVLVIAN